MLDVIIIGAGPYGISVAAHAVAKKLSFKLFGYPMDFWKNQMPQNMYIRTPHDLVSFSDPEGKYNYLTVCERNKYRPRISFATHGICALCFLVC